MRGIDHKSIVAVCMVWMAGVLIAGAACAQPFDGEPGRERQMKRHEKPNFAEMYEKLGLTKEQRAKLDDNREKHMAGFKTLREQVSEKREQLRAVLDAETLDMQAVKAVHQELTVLLVKMEDDHLNAVLEIREILTPEQFKKFQAMAPKGKGRHLKSSREEGQP